MGNAIAKHLRTNRRIVTGSGKPLVSLGAAFRYARTRRLARERRAADDRARSAAKIRLCELGVRERSPEEQAEFRQILLKHPTLPGEAYWDRRAS